MPSEQLFHFLAHPHSKVDNLYLALHKNYSNLIGHYSTDWQFKKEFMELLSFLKDRMEDDWNVMQKCMALEQPTITPYSLWYPLAVDTSSRFYISRDYCRRHTSPAGAICSQPQNDDSSREPAQSSGNRVGLFIRMLLKSSRAHIYQIILTFSPTTVLPHEMSTSSGLRGSCDVCLH